jgi:hypothetical protein
MQLFGADRSEGRDIRQAGQGPFIAKAAPLADIYAGEEASRTLPRRIAQA